MAAFFKGGAGLTGGATLLAGAGAADAAGSFTGFEHLEHIAVPPAE